MAINTDKISDEKVNSPVHNDTTVVINNSRNFERHLLQLCKEVRGMK
jgi:hypothetical protein